MKIIRPSLITVALFLAACSTESQHGNHHLIGTEEPFASEAIYFVLTDRFVDGDPTNNYEDQCTDIDGGRWHTFNRHFDGPNGRSTNVGYMGGDFKGLLNHADYIAGMGFTAVWMTPIVDNPDCAFNGGDPVGYNQWGDGGKTGFHGYWGVNFYQLDEHLPSAELDYRALNEQLKQGYGLKTVLDIVGNHGSPAYTAPKQISNFGKVYDANGNLKADHQNLHPEQLRDEEPLHAFFNRKPDVAQLADFNENNPELVDYLVNSYLQWIDQGADAIRIDTIKHMPHSFWKTVSDRIRAKHPGYFMFGESWNYDAEFIAQHTRPENGGVSVLDFPMQQAMYAIFGQEQAPYSRALEAMHLSDGIYHNVYELVTFYDNHDVQRLDASDQGFIDANNFIFTNRGIPQIYYGSEMGFERGMKEHQGSRNYYGEANIKAAQAHPIYQPLTAIAQVRKNTPALQRGLQYNVQFDRDTAVFYRAIDTDEISQTALVLLNKGDQEQSLEINKGLGKGQWSEALSGKQTELNGSAHITLAPHSVQVWVKDGPIDAPLRTLLQ